MRNISIFTSILLVLSATCSTLVCAGGEKEIAENEKGSTGVVQHSPAVISSAEDINSRRLSLEGEGHERGRSVSPPPPSAPPASPTHTHNAKLAHLEIEARVAELSRKIAEDDRAAAAAARDAALLRAATAAAATRDAELLGAATAAVAPGRAPDGAAAAPPEEAPPSNPSNPLYAPRPPIGAGAGQIIGHNVETEVRRGIESGKNFLKGKGWTWR